MRRIILVLVVTAGAFVSAFAQSPSGEDAVDLSYSALYDSRERYLGRLVRLNANYIYGFEWQFLCGSDDDCQKRRRDVWVEFADEDDLCKGSKGKLRKGSTKYVDNRAEVIFIGRLSAGSFGHFGAYKYQFTVQCVEKLKRRDPLN